jgi:hemerythrin-like domain-containing protein
LIAVVCLDIKTAFSDYKAQAVSQSGSINRVILQEYDMSTRNINISRQHNPGPRLRILNRLKVEHGQLLRKLNLLELQYLDMCRGKTPDYSLMQSIIVYIQEYPERIHHPLEDMIYSVLLERADNAGFVQKLISEHTQLEVVTREIRGSLESLPGCNDSGEQLHQQLSEFLVGQRQHIYTEESKVFPLLQSALTNKDWERLQHMTPLLDDPISGRRTWYDYERLSREIEDKHTMEFSGGENGNLNPTETERPQLV